MDSGYYTMTKAPPSELLLLWPDRPDGVFAVPCECREAKRLQVWASYCEKESGLTAVEREKYTFASFSRTANPGCWDARNLVYGFAEGLSAVPWLYLQSPPGRGKTHLLAACIGNLVKRENPVAACYFSAPDLYLQLVEQSHGEDFQGFIQSLKERAVLALDDLGAERQTEFGQDTIHGILDYRYRQGKPTLIASNKAPGEFTPRLASRLRDSSVVNLVLMQGIDIRLEVR